MQLLLLEGFCRKKRERKTARGTFEQVRLETASEREKERKSKSKRLKSSLGWKVVD